MPLPSTHSILLHFACTTHLFFIYSILLPATICHILGLPMGPTCPCIPTLRYLFVGFYSVLPLFHWAQYPICSSHSTLLQIRCLLFYTDSTTAICVLVFLPTYRPQPVLRRSSTVRVSLISCTVWLPSASAYKYLPLPGRIFARHLRAIPNFVHQHHSTVYFCGSLDTASFCSATTRRATHRPVFRHRRWFNSYRVACVGSSVCYRSSRSY